MKNYLVGIMYHEPEPYQQWLNGLIEDYESSTGIFVRARSEDKAIEWGERLADMLFRSLNKNLDESWKSFGYICWIEKNPLNSCWSHCLEFFQSVKAGELPNFELMGTDAYSKWIEKNEKL